MCARELHGANSVGAACACCSRVGIQPESGSRAFFFFAICVCTPTQDPGWHACSACNAPPRLRAMHACMASTRLGPTCVQRSPPCVAGPGAPSAAAPVPRGGEASSRDPLATRRSAKGAPRASDELLCALHLVELIWAFRPRPIAYYADNYADFWRRAK